MMFQWYSADGAAVHPLLVVMLALAMDVALGDPPRQIFYISGCCLETFCQLGGQRVT